MSRVYIAVPVDPAHAAEGIAEALAAYRESAEEHAERGYTGPPRVIRLRDRTGPSVSARLAHLETEHAAIVERVGELGRLPVASPPATTEPTPEQIEAYLRGSREWSQRDGEWWDHASDRVAVTLSLPDIVEAMSIGERCTHAEMRARILGASSATAEDPDRLAKVALRAIGGDIPWSAVDREDRARYRAIAAAVAEACAQDRTIQPTPHVPTESAGNAPSEAEMAAELFTDGMSPFYAADGSRRWMRRNFATPSDIEAAPKTATAHAAMRAAKGAR